MKITLKNKERTIIREDLITYDVEFPFYRHEFGDNFEADYWKVVSPTHSIHISCQGGAFDHYTIDFDAGSIEEFHEYRQHYGNTDLTFGLNQHEGSEEEFKDALKMLIKRLKEVKNAK